MANMNPKKNPMPCQTPEARARNFDEVALGYDEATALDTNRIDLGQSTVESIHIELALIEIFEFSLDSESLSTAAASRQNEAKNEAKSAPAALVKREKSCGS